MTFLQKINIIQRIDQLIKMKATGNPDKLAERLEISRSTVYEIIECMRAMDAEIDYCKTKQTFYYVKDKTLAIGFVDTKKINGGERNIPIFENIFQRPIFSDSRGLLLYQILIRSRDSCFKPCCVA
ncbi:MAG: hypothetical protein IPL55_01510 [Saprospiraceae bacterium]|nr:hypothetical protein [Saprospiraceae bacterium]